MKRAANVRERIGQYTSDGTLPHLTAERALELQYEVWRLRKKVREQTARAELWKRRALLYNRAKRATA